MVKRWRDKLTYQQLKRIMLISFISILVIVFLIPVILVGDQVIQLGKEAIVICCLWLGLGLALVVCIDIGIFYLLDGFQKINEFENYKAKKELLLKLEEWEFTRVYLKNKCKTNVCEFILDVYRDYEPKFFATREGDIIYVITNNKEPKEFPNFTLVKASRYYTIEDWTIFQENFSFTKE